MQIIFEQPLVKIFHDEDRESIRFVWKGKIPMDIYQEALNFGLDYMIQHDIKRIFVDQREIQPLTDAQQKWLYKVWFPVLFERLGENIRMAILPSAVTFRAISSKSIAKKLIDKHHKMKIEYHPTEKLANDFLLGKLT
ncbi:hypothetical protein [Mongoliitalea daihaiensis]|uniref:hypothetical protein n=1 Tax=Mongoliitalea daihaiensis TaxID=2782006 RepID=UPI001F218D78|nr:hypothetical protein [Mongoliitalea daihaiensis]UJP64561.1 hypothetical protein IPZ59_17410 [Mongoliitalea daihaiensis]